MLDLLQALARDEQAESLLLRAFAAGSLSRRTIGLADDVDACVFDLDGVLAASDEVHATAWAETLDPFLVERAELGHREFVPFDTSGDYRRLVAGRTRLDGARTFLASRGIELPEADVRLLADHKNEVLRRRLELQGVEGFAGSRGYLEAARVLGLRRAVVSASANTRSIVARAGLDGLVEEQIDGEAMEAEGLRPKPAPDTLLAACRRLGVEPARIAVFEASVSGVTAGRLTGCRLVFAVDRGDDSEALRASEADRVVTDLADLFAV